LRNFCRLHLQPTKVIAAGKKILFSCSVSKLG
jgi:hypothetical protein